MTHFYATYRDTIQVKSSVITSEVWVDPGTVFIRAAYPSVNSSVSVPLIPTEMSIVATIMP